MRASGGGGRGGSPRTASASSAHAPPPPPPPALPCAAAALACSRLWPQTLKTEEKRRGIMDVDPSLPSSITAFPPGCGPLPAALDSLALDSLCVCCVCGGGEGAGGEGRAACSEPPALLPAAVRPPDPPCSLPPSPRPPWPRSYIAKEKEVILGLQAGGREGECATRARCAHVDPPRRSPAPAGRPPAVLTASPPFDPRTGRRPSQARHQAAGGPLSSSSPGGRRLPPPPAALAARPLALPPCHLAARLGVSSRLQWDSPSPLARLTQGGVAVVKAALTAYGRELDSEARGWGRRRGRGDGGEGARRRTCSGGDLCGDPAGDLLL